MLFKSLATAAALSLIARVDAQAVHGQSAQGTTMGPVAFLWPSDRPWSATHDNVGPCGSAEGPSNRTNFPIGSAGAVSFSIADESTKIELRIAHGNNPTSQDDFKSFQTTIANFEPGHQCRSVPTSEDAVPGSNATLQLEYWNDSEKKEKYYACADITFVEATVFAGTIPCFNVTAEEFTPAGAKSSSSGLSTAEKAGIAVSVVVGSFLIASVVFFMIRRKKSAAKDAEAAPAMTKVASYRSGDAASRN